MYAIFAACILAIASPRPGPGPGCACDKVILVAKTKTAIKNLFIKIKLPFSVAIQKYTIFKLFGNVPSIFIQILDDVFILYLQIVHIITHYTIHVYTVSMLQVGAASPRLVSRPVFFLTLSEEP